MRPYTEHPSMETFLLLVFAAVAAIAALLELSKRQSSKQETTNRDFSRFRNNYVLVYALMMGANDAPPPSVHRCTSLNACPTPFACAWKTSLRLTDAGMQHLPTPCAYAAGDWLQGPYVYALYQYYGFDRGQIGRLFIGGFASSMVFGTLVGSLADKQ